MLSNYPDVEQVVPTSERPRVEAALARLQRQLSAEDRRIVGVRYIAGRRRAFVFEVQTKLESEAQSYFMKIGVRADAELVEYVNGEARNTHAVYCAMNNSGPLGVTEPIAFFEDLVCLVLKGNAGQRLDALIVSSCRGIQNTERMETVQHYCELAADWLTEFQAKVDVPDSPTHTTVDALRARVERELVVLSASSENRFTEAQCRDFRGTADSLLADFLPGDLKTCARHNDFAPWNILCDAGQICVIDYADLKAGCAYFDAYQFIDAMHVLSNKLTVLSPRVLALKRHFIEHCAAIQRTSPAVDQYFRLLQKLIRVNAVLNNSTVRFPYSLRNRYLLNRYLRSINDDLQIIPQDLSARTGL